MSRSILILSIIYEVSTGSSPFLLGLSSYFTKPKKKQKKRRQHGMGEFVNSIKLSVRDDGIPVFRLDIFRALKAFFEPGELPQLVRIG